LSRSTKNYPFVPIVIRKKGIKTVKMLKKKTKKWWGGVILDNDDKPEKKAKT
jgi:hypothetical protein